MLLGFWGGEGGWKATTLRGARCVGVKKQSGLPGSCDMEGMMGLKHYGMGPGLAFPSLELYKRLWGEKPERQ